MPKGTTPYAFVMLLTLSVIGLGQSPRIDSKSSTPKGKEIEGPTITLRATTASKSGALRLIASEYVEFEEPVTLTPTDPTTVENRQSPTLVSVVVPENHKRTYLFLSLGGIHSWHQIPSSAAYQMTGSFNVKCTSAALPSPGFFSFNLILNGQVDDQPSMQGTTRFGDPAASFGLENTILDAVFKGSSGLSPEQRAQLIKDFLQSEITIELRVRVRMRSVDGFSITDSYLQMYGDG